MDKNWSQCLSYVSFSDVTQREGRQCHGNGLVLEASQQLLHLIDDCAIDFVELPHPASSQPMRELISTSLTSNLKHTKIAAHVRCTYRDIKLAVDLGAKYIHTYIPIDPKTPSAIDAAIDSATGDLQQLADILKARRISLRVSLEHTFSIDPLLAKQSYTRLYDKNTDLITRLGFADTTGCCFPDQIERYVLAISEIMPSTVPFHFHLHNDSGLAAANFLRLVSILPKIRRPMVFDISVGGMGERNGILSYGDVFSIMYLLDKEYTVAHYQLDRYALLYSFVNRGMNKTVFSPRDPLNPDAFSHSAGPHLKGMLENNRYQLIEPTSFGMRTVLNVVNAGTGWHGIMHWVKNTYRLEISPYTAKAIAGQVRDAIARLGALSEQQLVEIVKMHLPAAELSGDAGGTTHS